MPRGIPTGCRAQGKTLWVADIRHVECGSKVQTEAQDLPGMFWVDDEWWDSQGLSGSESTSCSMLGPYSEILWWLFVRHVDDVEIRTPKNPLNIRVENQNSRVLFLIRIVGIEFPNSSIDEPD